MRFENLTIRGQRGIHATAPTSRVDVRFEQFAGTALVLDDGVHWAVSVRMDSTVNSGADVAAGTMLVLRSSRLEGVYGTAIHLAGTAPAKTDVIASAAQGIALSSRGDLTLRNSTLVSGSGVGDNFSTDPVLDGAHCPVSVPATETV